MHGHSQVFQTPVERLTHPKAKEQPQAEQRTRDYPANASESSVVVLAHCADCAKPLRKPSVSRMENRSKVLEQAHDGRVHAAGVPCSIQAWRSFRST